MKQLVLLSTFLCCGLMANAQTHITTPTVSGHWAMSGSPYLVETDLFIPSGSALTIDPGVEVKFMGHYQVYASGVIKAIGTASAPIAFHAADTTGWSNDHIPAGGWKGIYFALFSDTGSVLEYCNISDCKYGGDTAIATSTGTITSYKDLRLSHCDIFHNQCTAPVSAGGIIRLSLYEGHQVMNDCKVHDNLSTWSTTELSNGGTMTVSFTGNQVYNNTSSYPVWFVNVNGTIEGNELHHNHSSGSGGTLTIQYNSILTIKGNKIHHNTAERAAAIVALSSVVDLNSNLICNNYSTVATCGLVDGGAAMQISSNFTGTYNAALIRNNVIVNNRTEFNGGAVNLIYANAEIMNNTIVNNSASKGGAIYMMNNSQTVNVKNNVMFNNEMVPMLGMVHYPNMFLFNSYNVGYSHNWAQGHLNEDLYSVVAPSVWGDTTGNLADTLPMFVAPTLAADYNEDATTADFRLISTSLCIDAGDTAGAYPYATDYAGNPRITGSRIDMGAYEWTGSTTPGAVAGPARNADAMVVFPMPAHDAVNIALPADGGKIDILDMAGRVVMSQTVSARLQPISIGQLPAGQYLVRWTDNANHATTTNMVKN
jgi:hypothetical protein